MSAVISLCGLYRYELRRVLAGDGDGQCVFVMLNPSTADAETDDPTVRRCINFAHLWGCSELVVVNLFAFRASSPKDMMAASDPVGPENDRYIALANESARMVVCAWGARGGWRGRDNEVLRVINAGPASQLMSLGFTKDGQPRHPLYVRGNTELKIWRGCGEN